MKKGIKLIENGLTLYLGALQDPTAWCKDSFYCKEMNCYYFDYQNSLFRKDINGQPPYLYMAVNCGYRIGSYFRYLEGCGRLFVARNCREIAMVDLKSQQIEASDLISGEDVIEDFRVWGGSEAFSVCLTDNGVLAVHKFDVLKKICKIFLKKKIKLINKRREKGSSIIACPDGRYLFVELQSQFGAGLVSRYLTFEITPKELVFRASRDLLSQSIPYHMALNSLYLGRHLLVVLLTFDSHSQVQVVDFDLDMVEVKELVERRVETKQSYPFQLVGLDNRFYFVGKSGKVMRLKLKI